MLARALPFLPSLQPESFQCVVVCTSATRPSPAKQHSSKNNNPTLPSPLRPHHTTHPHNVRLRPHPQRNSRARHSFRPPGPEGALRAAARPARRLLRLCWQVRWRRRCPRPPPRGVFRGVHCQVCRSCVAVFWEGRMMLEECNGWRRDGEVKQARKKRILAHWAPQSSCTTAASSRGLLEQNSVGVGIPRRHC